ncbi:hypothetical protein NG796_16765 [Laspinema sp. A4]|uniref:hypothetical protein n=1 Tax=Laspinema sp. D2d TaxID=2953686 RepID=UPI0021BADD61|nr:hypothetical protein [Laspinema sp. D2d]MCT7984925.1 hypothetical protein [Laspinema sp. D2d]
MATARESGVDVNGFAEMVQVESDSPSQRLGDRRGSCGRVFLQSVASDSLAG